MHPRRVLALALTFAILLAVNTYSGLALYAFTAGPRAEAVVVDCSGGKNIRCWGRWTRPDGSTGGGTISGANTFDRGGTVGVRIAPITGAYKDTAAVLWIRLSWAVLADLATLAAWTVVAVVAARSRREAVALTAAAGSDADAWRARGLDIVDRAGNPVWLGHRSGRTLHTLATPDGAVRFGVRGGDGVLGVDDHRGAPVGWIDADRSDPARLAYLVRDGAAAPLAAITCTRRRDSAWAVSRADGTVYARFVVTVGERRLVFEPGAPAALRPLLAAFLLDCDRMLHTGGSGPVSVSDLRRRHATELSRKSRNA
ncbi:hypothetical protein [Nocardia otitidiscaviarum]|uniref:hypothetical protein n=1 Tax=Nocardia otitidiscaviarum TaxID=1823 RepID=UPI002454BAAE|nr:hypothetical protein [Nocardia otitidiscaviarum]